MTPNRIVRENGKKVLLQHPDTQTCGLVAVINAWLQDNSDIEDSVVYQTEETYSKRYNIEKEGLQDTVIGAIAYELGYHCSLTESENLTALHAQRYGKNGFHVIKYCWYYDGYNPCLNNSGILQKTNLFKTQFDGQDVIVKKSEEEIKGWNKLVKGYQKNKRQPTSRHAVLVTKINPKNNTAFFLNLVWGVNCQYDWDLTGVMAQSPWINNLIMWKRG